jgi:hypothetical protein
MKLEKIFEKNMKNLERELHKFTLRDMEASKYLKINQDPHIERLIESFAMLTSFLEEKNYNIIQEEILGILNNIDKGFRDTIPPIGIINFSPQKSCIVNTNFVCNGATFKPMFVTSINKLSIKDVFYTNNEIVVSVTGIFKDVKYIDLFLDAETIISIFEKKREVICTIKSDKGFSSDAKVTFTLPDDIVIASIYPQVYQFIRCEGNFSADSMLEIRIPAKSCNPICSINLLPVMNLISVTSTPSLGKNGIYPIVLPGNYELLNINKVFAQSEKKNIELSKEDWYVLDDNVHIRNEVDGKIYVDAHAYQQTEEYDDLLAEDYVPAKMSWYKIPSKKYKIPLSSVETYIQLFNNKEKIYGLIGFLNNLTHIKINDVEEYNKVRPEKIKTLEGVKLVSSLGKYYVLNVETNNYILLYSIFDYINKTRDGFADMEFRLGNYSLTP